MYKVDKIKSKTKPSKFVDLHSGAWYYNFDITEIDGIYEYVQIRIEGKPTFYKCFNSILNLYKDEDNSLYEEYQISNNSDLIEDIYEKIQIDFGIKEKESDLDIAKHKVIKKIDEYDKSSNVNSFTINGLNVWFDKDTRVGLMNSLNIEKNSGKEQSTLWFGNVSININCDAAIQLLSALELYALQCYNTTAQHKVNINNLTTIEEVNSYNYTSNYPTKLTFNI